jgi:DNA polymerase III epsilon subunit-like protein
MPCLPFVAIDVETANLNNANICQFGVAFFWDGALSGTSAILVDPESSFNPRFKAIHGITPATVRGALTWQELYSQLELFSERTLDDCIVVSHTYFDRDSIRKACERYGLRPPAPKVWLDTCEIARRIWPDMQNHKLSTLAQHFEICYEAHNAGEDARCAGEILLCALQQSGRTMESLIEEHLGRELGKEVSLTVQFRTEKPPSPEEPATTRLESRPQIANPQPTEKESSVFLWVYSLVGLVLLSIILWLLKTL